MTEQREGERGTGLCTYLGLREILVKLELYIRV
jgi:hypothetical protein